MDQKNLEVLTNIIGAVESGGQIYGKRRYDAYDPPYKNSKKEVTITIGWYQAYGHEARQLIQTIYDVDPIAFMRLDTPDAAVEEMLRHDWVGIKWKPTAKEKAAIIALIDSPVGHAVQDRIFEEKMAALIADCARDYTDDVKAQMMYCEIRHLGGKGPCDRIFQRCAGKYDLDTIMAALARDQQDKSSDNQVGDAKYWSRHLKCRTFIDRYAVDEKTAEKEKDMAHYISNSGGDENGRVSGGKAGDQTGKEWCLRTWYNRPWSCVLRHPTAAVRAKIAELAEKAAKNDKVGYDQGQRYTYWDRLQKANYDPSKITEACEADCSAGVIANVKAAGHILGIKELQETKATYTGDMKAGLKAAGFKVLTDSKYLTGPDYLLPGDILLYEGHHTATNITKGSKADDSSDADESYIVGTCTITLKKFLPGASDPQVKTIQRILRELGYKDENGKELVVDGDLGTHTAYAIAAFQKAEGLAISNPGSVAAKTWGALLRSKSN